MSQGANWRRRVGDTAPALDKQLRDPPAPGDAVGPIVDLTGVTSVHGIIRRHSDAATLFDAPVAIVDYPTGMVAISLDGTITAVASLCTIEWVATWPDRQVTYPVGIDYDHLLVTQEITSSAPAAPVPDGPGVPPSGGIMAWDSGEAEWLVDHDARHYIRYPGDPDPAPLMARNDIVVTII